MRDERFSKYMAEDAERWEAVHERIRGLTINLMAVTDAAISLSPALRDGIILRLQEVLEMYVPQQVHPDRLEVIREFLEGLEGQAPTMSPKRT